MKEQQEDVMKEYWEKKLAEKLDFINHLLERAVREEEAGRLEFAEKILGLCDRHEKEIAKIKWEISKY